MIDSVFTTCFTLQCVNNNLFLIYLHYISNTQSDEGGHILLADHQGYLVVSLVS